MTALTDVVIDDVAAQTLLRTFVREVAAPDHQVDLTSEHLLVCLPRTGQRLRVRLARRSHTDNHRFIGPVERVDARRWSAVDAAGLGELVAAELTVVTGVRNSEFAEQLRESVLGSTRAHRAVIDRVRRPAVTVRQAYLASEQALWAGHRWHPTPKSRDEDEESWARFAPEAAPRIGLRWLAIPAEAAIGADARGGAQVSRSALAGGPDPGHGRVAHPVHPWQWQRIRHSPHVRDLLRSRAIRDLGQGPADHDPTSSVRTLLGPQHFVKFSLGVRITNCVRRHAPYELTGAMHLDELIGDTLADLGPSGVHFLRETGWRSAQFDDDPGVIADLGLIVREGLDDVLEPGVTPLVAATLAAEHTGPAGQLAAVTDAQRGHEWWERYLRLLVPYVIEAYTAHGIVTEPHLQNVVVGVAADGMPVQVFLRDLEGVKLLPRWRDRLQSVDPVTASRLVYDDRAGWQRVAYCLMVNNLSEFVGALADLGCDEGALWAQVREELGRCASGSGSHEIRALLDGASVPAKSNLLVRWRRRADRAADYVPVVMPLAAHHASRAMVSA
ncbi:IucA/IucC family protein [Luteipulveratus mongoliensis]|uniref:Iron transporter n=1 Tax=Luteipulveratus mongoliensis TaxID=571913 RepID=A0A0K1JNU2_9MICO|nr:IucA/IucC family protein [Luteipulveratus mongoliensis]AKU18235.1 hypothetical protein VV02_24240 [Luteipulveratus mongoliensis]